LYQFTNQLKQDFLKNAPAIDKVCYDSKLDVIHHALGLHTAVSRVQGSKLKAKKEIRIASLFKDTCARIFDHDCGARNSSSKRATT
jgi:predicted metal-dependent hydrolase